MRVYDTYSNEQLLHLLSKNDQEAFTALYHRFHAGIYHYLLTFVKSSFHAQDLTQEVFLKIWSARQRINVYSSFEAYIFRISHNAAFDFMKKMAADRALHKEIIWQSQTTTAINHQNDLVEKEYEKIYHDAIASLTKQGLKVFLLCREEGKTYEEAASIMGISHHTVKEHMANALHRLRSFLAKKTLAALQVMVLFWIF
jgi:RNA polymerase sigma-70 factor (family 1)